MSHPHGHYLEVCCYLGITVDPSFRFYMIYIDPFSEMSGKVFGYDRHSVWFNSYIWITLQVPCHSEPVQTWQEFWKKSPGKRLLSNRGINSIYCIIHHFVTLLESLALRVHALKKLSR